MLKQMLINITAKFAHRVVTFYEPEPIYKTIHVPTHPRSCQELFSTLKAKTNRRKRCLIIRLPKVYNSIPSCLKLLNPYSFKKKLRTFEIAETPITWDVRKWPHPTMTNWKRQRTSHLPNSIDLMHGYSYSYVVMGSTPNMLSLIF